MRIALLVLVVVLLSIAQPAAQYPPGGVCAGGGPVYAEWCANGTQDMCAAFHIGPTYENPYGDQIYFNETVEWPENSGVYYLHGHKLTGTYYDFWILDGTRQHPYCEQ